ncbi:hypothetical protein TWF481_010730 [Arthrobotrys musiformis]|uniref:Uncharacterized protein n=1 Tax=Arthrobotrys musiformis TaxID=47236 RepID=A0AAV9W1Q9_9PEZI
MPTTSKIDRAELIHEGIGGNIYTFADAPVYESIESSEPLLKGAPLDDKAYGRGGYDIAERIPTGPEYNIKLPESVTKFNSLSSGCLGQCDGSPWHYGLDKGFAALAGVEVEKPKTCGFSLKATGKSEDIIAEELIRTCGGRCANYLYGTTLALSARTEDPGFRTVVALMCNWSSWLSCAMYDSWSEWINHEGDGFVWADTLKTSKIHFVETDSPKFPIRAHDPKILKKGNGWDDDASEAWIDACKKYGLRGMHMQPNIGFVCVSMEKIWFGNTPLAMSCANIDMKFCVDYNLHDDESPCKAWWDIVDKYSDDCIAGGLGFTEEDKNYISAFAAASAYSHGFLQAKLRREIEAGKNYKPRRGGLLWEDPELMSTYIMTDIGGAQYSIMSIGCAHDVDNFAIGRLMNDVVDLGYDWKSGSVANFFLTLAGCKMDRDSLVKAYRKTCALFNYLTHNYSNNSTMVVLAVGHIMQISNTRHPVVACSLISDDLGIGPTDLSGSWHDIGIRGKDPVDKIDLNIRTGELNGKQVELTDRSWKALATDETGLLAQLLEYGHIWIIERRREGVIPPQAEIEKIEDAIRITVLKMMTEMAQLEYLEALTCYAIESWCATDVMWHAMVGSTAVITDLRVGFDGWVGEENKQ